MCSHPDLYVIWYYVFDRGQLLKWFCPACGYERMISNEQAVTALHVSEGLRGRGE
jgi:hypothetical protein